MIDQPTDAPLEENIPLDVLAERAAGQFAARFGRRPRWVVAAPGRVNLIGEHTDYNDGFVLPMAIERYVVIAADQSAGDSPNQPPTANVFSVRADESATIPLDTPLAPQPPAWSNYVRGVIAGYLARDINPGGFDALIDSTVPLGAGLSSSAALETAVATLVEAASGKRLDAVEKALLCQQAEHDFAGVPCGIMDQFTSALGQENHLLLLDCRSREATLVPFVDPTITTLVINTHVSHELVGGEYAERRRQCNEAAAQLGVAHLRDATSVQLEAARDRIEPVCYRRARHVIGEIERTVSAARAIEQGDWREVGSLMAASHASLRDDFEVSTPELDLLVDLATSLGDEHGVVGSRMTGGGFGGCTVSLVRTEALTAVARFIREGYLRQTGTEPTLFSTRPAAGAQIVSVTSTDKRD